MKPSIHFRSEVFREGDLYVALCPDLSVSSFGETPIEARESLKEAVEGFIEECESMGTLKEVLEEAGYAKSKNHSSRSNNLTSSRSTSRPDALLEAIKSFFESTLIS